MSNVFISYSARDSAIARSIHERCLQLGLTAFLAEVSLEPGDQWKDKILAELKEADWVIFLATPNSCASDAVKHEIGGALVLGKAFVAVRVGVEVAQLPDWIKDKHAVDGTDSEAIQAVVSGVAKKVRKDLLVAGMVIGAIVLGIMWLAGKSTPKNT
jgi:hypothetical protein